MPLPKQLTPSDVRHPYKVFISSTYIDNYGFMHLGFQEYLAARKIRSRAFEEPKVLEELAFQFGKSWWQEVALEDPWLFVPFMREVVKQPTFAKDPQFVEMCLDDAAEISPKPFEELLIKTPGKASCYGPDSSSHCGCSSG